MTRCWVTSNGSNSNGGTHGVQEGPLPDYLAPGLKVVFVGFNPGQRSAELGRHYAGYTNHFWRLIHDTRFTDRLLTPQEDSQLLNYGYGLTNIVPRPSPSSADLEWDELVEGGRELREKLRTYSPGVVCLLGKNVYRAYAGLRRGARVEWGVQEPGRLPPIIDFLAPNPSTRSTIPYERRLELFNELRGVVDGQGRGER